MANFDNPAGRLMGQLQMAQKVTSSNPDISVLRGWSRVFRLEIDEAGGRYACLQRCADVAVLGPEVRSAALRLPPHLHPGLMLKNFGEVESTLDHFTNATSSTMSHFFHPLKETGWHSLEMLDAMLSTHAPEPSIDDGERKDLYSRVGSLMEDLQEDETLPKDARDFVLSRLRDVLTALFNIDLYGTRRVEDATDALVTALWRKCGGEWIKNTPTGKKAAGVVMAISMAIGMGANVKALLPGPGDAPVPTVIEQTTNVDVDVDVLDGKLVVGDPQSSQAALTEDSPKRK